MMRLLITGARGQLGRKLVDVLQNDHEIAAYGRDELDITDADQTAHRIKEFHPDLIIHTAAMTKVDYCAENPDEALWANGYGTQHVAYAAREVDAALVYVSTNEVFDGQNTGAYLEHDRANPINHYGYSKWVGEQMVKQLLQKCFIVRVSWLFGHGGGNFIHTIRRLAEQYDKLRVVVNEVATPTYVNDFAEALVQLIGTQYYGTYHLVNEGRASRWTFARYILDLSGYEDKEIERIAAAEYPRPSTPPEYAVLRNFAGLQRGIVLRDWREAVEDFLHKEAARSG
jgi:dTDP-4-dehydrorhamnose reductase